MKYYLITTLHNQHTRWQYIKGHLDELGIDYTPILAPDFRQYLHAGLSETQAKHLSLVMAYYQIAQTAEFEEIDEYVVMEDDVQIGDYPLLKSLIKMFDVVGGSSFDLVYLTQTEHNRLSAVTTPMAAPYFNRIRANWWETPITMWSARFAHAFIGLISMRLTSELWLGHIDHILNQMNETGKYKFYGSNHNIANGLSCARHLAEGLPISFEGSISEQQQPISV